MAGPGFRFRRLLRFKAQLRKTLQTEIATLRQEIASVENAIAGAEAAREQNRAAATQAAAEGRLAADLQLHEAYDRAQAGCARTLSARVAALGELVEARRSTLIERRREERQLETLEARQRDREAVAAAQSEANLQDDLAVRAKSGRAVAASTPDEHSRPANGWWDRRGGTRRAQKDGSR